MVVATAVLLVGVPHATHAYLTTAEAVDTSGVLLHDGDLISSIDSADPDVYIIKFAPVPSLVGYGSLPDAGSLGYKRLFLNPAIFGFYGHLGGFSRVHRVTARVRDAFTTSGLFRNCETNDTSVWATEVTGEDAGTLHHVEMTGAQAVSEDPFFFHKVFCINTLEANWYPRSITPYRHLSEIPPYKRLACIPRPACLDSVPQCYPPEPIGGWCPAPTPTPSPYVSSVSVSSASPGTRITLYGSGFTGYTAGTGGFTDQVMLSGTYGGTWMYATDVSSTYIMFTVPNVIFPSPCTGDPQEQCTQTIGLPSGHYFIRVIIAGDQLTRKISNTVDLDITTATPTPVPTILPTITSVQTQLQDGASGHIWAAIINGTLPNSCYLLDTANVSKSGTDFFISLTAAQRNGTGYPCSNVVQSFSSSVSLGLTNAIPSGTYRIFVNGVHWAHFTP